MLRIIKMNLPEWPYLIIGSVAGIINGLFPFAFALVLSEILAVSNTIKFTFIWQAIKCYRVLHTGYIHAVVLHKLAFFTVQTCPGVNANREVKHDVYGKRQTAKMNVLPSLFNYVYGRVKLFVFAMNSRRRYFIFVCSIYGLKEMNSKSEVVFAVCRLP